MNGHAGQKQTGAALIVALLVLLVLTLLGVASLNNMTLEERMAANFSSAETGFQSAETAIRAVVFDGTKFLSDASGDPTVINSAYDLAHDPFVAGMDTCKTAQAVTPHSELDPTGAYGNQSVSVGVTMSYDGWSTSLQCVGSGTELGVDTATACAIFDIQSAAQVGSGRHQGGAIHVQQVNVPMQLGPGGAPCPQ